MLRILALAGVLLAAVPVAAANHWTYDSGDAYFYPGSSSCAYTDAVCVAEHHCTGGAPPQVVDRAVYCAGRLAVEGDDLALWVPVFAWAWVDGVVEETEEQPAVVNAATSAQRAQVNAVLCGQVWSFFCTNPVALPSHVPVADPVGAYPLP